MKKTLFALTLLSSFASTAQFFAPLVETVGKVTATKVTPLLNDFISIHGIAKMSNEGHLLMTQDKADALNVLLKVNGVDVQAVRLREGVFMLRGAAYVETTPGLEMLKQDLKQLKF